MTTAAENVGDPYFSHDFQSAEHLIDNNNMHMASIHPFSPYLVISGNRPFMSHSVTLLWFAQHMLATNHTSDGFFLVNKKKDSVFVTPSLHFGCMEGAMNAKGSKTNLQITTCDVQHLLPRQVALKVSNAHQRQRLV